VSKLRGHNKKTIAFFFILLVIYSILFIGLCKTPLYEITTAHNDRLFSADDIHYVKQFYSVNLESDPRVIKHPLLMVFACLFTRVEAALFGSISIMHHYMLIVCFQMVCWLLSVIYLFKILNELYQLEQRYTFLFCCVYAAAFSTIFYTFIAESYIFSSLLLLMTYYYGRKEKMLPTVLLGVLTAGITTSNAVLWAVIVFFSGGKMKHRLKVMIAGGVLFCLVVAALPIREQFYSYIIKGSLNSVRNYSDSFTLGEVLIRVFFAFFGSTVFYLDTINQSAFGDFVGDALAFIPSASIPVIVMGGLWLLLLIYTIVRCRKDKRLLAPLGVLAANLLLHGVVQYGLKEAFLYSLHHLSTQILIVSLLFAPSENRSGLASRTKIIACFIGLYLLAAVILNLPGYREIMEFISK